MLNVLNTMASSVPVGTGCSGDKCACKDCIRKRKLAMLGFDSNAVSQYLDGVKEQYENV